MPRRRVRFLILSLTFSGLIAGAAPLHAEPQAASAAMEQSLRQQKNDDTLVQSWDLFNEGCLRSGGDLSAWADRFSSILEKIGDTDPSTLSAMGRSLGYPRDDPTLAAWRVTGSRITLLEQGHQGCTVSHDIFVPPETMNGLVTGLARNIGKGTRTEATVERKTGKTGQYMMLIKSPARSGAGKRRDNRYLLFVSSPDSGPSGTRTVMHSFLSASDFKL